MLEAAMSAAGYDVPAYASSLEEAVVDILWRGNPAIDLVRELRRRRIPFVVYTGFEPEPDLAEEFRGAPWLAKPSEPSDIVDARRCLGNSSQAWSAAFKKAAGGGGRNVVGS
jgi:hypothetical protein